MTYIGNEQYEIALNGETIKISIEDAKEILSDMISFENNNRGSAYIGLTEYNASDLINKSTFLTNRYLNELEETETDTINDFLEEACQIQENELNEKYILIER